MTHSKDYILIASSDCARIYKKNGSVLEHTQQMDYTHPEIHLKERDGDTPGHTHESATYGGHAYEPHTSYTAHHHHLFAVQLAHILEKLHQEKAFDNLAVVAAPALLGELRVNLSKAVRNAVKKELAADYAHLSEHDLALHLKKEGFL